MGSRMRRCARCAGYDQSRRHQHGDFERSGPDHEGSGRSHRAVNFSKHMDKKNVRDRIVEIGIVPVIRASSSRAAFMAAEAVAEGGIPIVEITMTVPGAVEVIRELAKTNSSKILI